MGRITVGTVSYYSVSHITSLFQSLERNTVDSELRLIVCDNTNGQDTDLYRVLADTCDIIPFAPVNPRRRKRERASGSYAHGLGLNLLLSKIDTQYCLFVDPDCLILARGWDVVCKDSLSEQCIAIGAPYHSRKIIKYHGFPSPIFVFFKPEAFRIMEADWTPYTDSLLVYIWDQFLRTIAILGGNLGERAWGPRFYTSRMAEVMRRFLGNSSKDTGWKNQIKAQLLGYSAKLLTPAVTSGQLALGFAEEPSVVSLMNEYELFLWRGVPFVTHYHSTARRAKSGETATVQRWRQLAASVSAICPAIGVQESLLDITSWRAS